MELDLEKEISELKAAQAALKRAVGEKKSIEKSVGQHEGEVLTAGSTRKLSENEMKVLVKIFKKSNLTVETSSMYT